MLKYKVLEQNLKAFFYESWIENFHFFAASDAVQSFNLVSWLLFNFLYSKHLIDYLISAENRLRICLKSYLEKIFQSSCKDLDNFYRLFYESRWIFDHWIRYHLLNLRRNDTNMNRFGFLKLNGQQIPRSFPRSMLCKWIYTKEQIKLPILHLNWEPSCKFLFASLINPYQFYFLFFIIFIF